MVNEAADIGERKAILIDRIAAPLVFLATVLPPAGYAAYGLAEIVVAGLEGRPHIVGGVPDVREGLLKMVLGTPFAWGAAWGCMGIFRSRRAGFLLHATLAVPTWCFASKMLEGSYVPPGLLAKMSIPSVVILAYCLMRLLGVGPTPFEKDRELDN